MLNSLALNNNKKVTNWILKGISPEKKKPFYPSLAPVMSNLANCRISIKSNSSALEH